MWDVLTSRTLGKQCVYYFGGIMLIQPICPFIDDVPALHLPPPQFNDSRGTRESFEFGTVGARVLEVRRPAVRCYGTLSAGWR